MNWTPADINNLIVNLGVAATAIAGLVTAIKSKTLAEKNKAHGQAMKEQLQVLADSVTNHDEQLTGLGIAVGAKAGSKAMDMLEDLDVEEPKRKSKPNRRKSIDPTHPSNQSEQETEI